MGFLRFILAAAVVAEHSTPIFGVTLIGGHLAVKLFFIISGFYMALILETKYTATQPNRFWLFITNRFLRIYPAYFAVFLLSLLFYAAASFHLGKPADRLLFWQDASAQGHGFGLVWIAVSQMFVFGMDAVCLFAYSTTEGFFLPSASDAVDINWLPAMAEPGIAPAWRFMFVPQAWSISLELTFYLLAPLLMAWRTRSLVLISVLSLTFNLVFAWMINPNLSKLLNYFFFPTQLYLFVLGILAYRYSGKCLSILGKKGQVGIVALAFGMIGLYQFIPLHFKNALCVVAVVMVIPVLFRWTKNSTFNKHLGDLSYPIYIGHVFVKWVLLAGMGIATKGAASPPGWLLLACSTAFAALLLWGIDHRIDKFRQRRVNQNSMASIQTGVVR
jgi:peptidoglycan/LPS O-acetylase OafA/YrhL